MNARVISTSKVWEFTDINTPVITHGGALEVRKMVEGSEYMPFSSYTILAAFAPMHWLRWERM